jgi:hypothetical protein
MLIVLKWRTGLFNKISPRTDTGKSKLTWRASLQFTIQLSIHLTDELLIYLNFKRRYSQKKSIERNGRNDRVAFGVTATDVNKRADRTIPSLGQEPLQAGEYKADYIRTLRLCRY